MAVILLLAWDAIQLAEVPTPFCIAELSQGDEVLEIHRLACPWEGYQALERLLAESELDLSEGPQVVELRFDGKHEIPLRIRDDLSREHFESGAIIEYWGPDEVEGIGARVEPNELPLYAPELPAAAWIRDWRAPELKSAPRPRYTHEGCTATVWLGALGELEGFETSCSDGASQRATDKAVAQMEFRPLRVQGVPTATAVSLWTDGERWLLGPPPQRRSASGEVHWTQVRPKRPAQPRYPEGAAAGACAVRVFIDEWGEVYSLAFEDCPEPFQGSVRKAIFESSYWPMEVDGQPVKAQFVYEFRFRRGRL